MNKTALCRMDQSRAALSALDIDFGGRLLDRSIVSFGAHLTTHHLGPRHWCRELALRITSRRFLWINLLDLTTSGLIRPRWRGRWVDPGEPDPGPRNVPTNQEDK
ncbi:MAG: hypothetical protein GY722_14030 [bacterium]|nr:hypothetical protein [bacterium]